MLRAYEPSRLFLAQKPKQRGEAKFRRMKQIVRSGSRSPSYEYFLSFQEAESTAKKNLQKFLQSEGDEIKKVRVA